MNHVLMGILGMFYRCFGRAGAGKLWGDSREQRLPCLVSFRGRETLGEGSSKAMPSNSVAYKL